MSVEDLIDPNVEEHLCWCLWKKSKMPAARAHQIILVAAQRLAQEHRGPLSKDRFNVQLMDTIDPPERGAVRSPKTRPRRRSKAARYPATGNPSSGVAETVPCGQG